MAGSKKNKINFVGPDIWHINKFSPYRMNDLLRFNKQICMDHFDGTIPFNFKTWIDLANCCTYNRMQMVNSLSMVVTFPIAGAVYGLVILSWAWDYAITTTLIHFGLSCLVMLDFPYSWSWWLCLGVGLVLMVVLAELVSWLRRYRNKSRLVVPASAANQAGSFLYK